MPRNKRKLSETGIYHIVIRGINKQLIFEEDEDFNQFLHILSEVKEIADFKLFAYCLLGNHIHLLIREGKEPLAQVFKRIGARYVFWFNWKYERNGHLFQDRFLSEPVESDEYFATVLAYIYQNPINAGLSKRTEGYQWSSRRLLGRESIIDEAELSNIMSLETIPALDRQEIKDEILKPKVGRKLKISDSAALDLLKEIGKVSNASAFQLLDRELQTETYLQLRSKGVSIRQFARLSGLSKGVVERMGFSSRVS